MNLREVKKHYFKMKKMFSSLPNPDHQPKQFEFYVKMYKYHMQND